MVATIRHHPIRESVAIGFMVMISPDAWPHVSGSPRVIANEEDKIQIATRQCSSFTFDKARLVAPADCA
jgi:hypothetical protein